MSTTFANPGLPESITANGQLHTFAEAEHLPIGNREQAFLVEKGQVEIFFEDSAAESAKIRSHLTSIGVGSLFFVPSENGEHSVAVGLAGSAVRSIPRSLLRDLPLQDKTTVCKLVENWVATLSTRVAQGIKPRPKIDQIISGGETTRLDRGKTARSRKGITWAQPTTGDLLFLGLTPVRESVNGGFFPVSTASWIEAVDNCDLRCVRLQDIFDEERFWSWLDGFYALVLASEETNLRLSRVDEFNQLRAREQSVQRDRRTAISDIASVLKEDERQPALAISLGGEVADPLLGACRLVAAASGISVVAPPYLNRATNKAAAIAKASQFRLRRVALRGKWWESEHGPLLGGRAISQEPVAILPRKRKGYTLVDPLDGSTATIDADIAATLHPFALSFYTPLPSPPISAWGLVKFGLRNCRRDLWMVILMGVMIGLLGLVAPFFSSLIFDYVIPAADRTTLWQMTGALIAAAVGSFAFDIVRAIAVLRLTSKLDYTAQAAVWDRLLSLPSTFFRNYTAGDLTDRALGVDQIRQAVSQTGTQALVSAVSSLVMIAFLFRFSWQLALVAVALLAIGVGFPLALNLAQLKYQRSLFYIRGRISGLVLQLINGVNKLRTTGSEDRAFREWAHRFAEQKKMAFTSGRFANVVRVFNAVFPVCGAGLLFAGYEIFRELAIVNGQIFDISTGAFVGLITLFGTVLTSLLQLSTASIDLLTVVPLFERLKPILETAPEFDQLKSYPGELTGSIEVQHISFRYSEAGPLVLRNVSLEVRPGEFVALVGQSGSGKSTLLRLLLGFEQPETGSIYYDGQDLNTLDVREVRQQIGVVLQTSRVLPTDIFHNIIGSSNLTLDEAWEAARLAGLADDIAAMPMGMHTVVSEGGSTFSGGQRQRLMIARALVNKPRIIFFDEATSSLDNETQRIVTASLEALQATRAVIAHRLSTIMNADRIYVLENGSVVEQGSYAELMEHGGRFFDLATRQLA